MQIKHSIFFALKGNIEIANLLIEKGADVNAINSKTLTPLMFAALKGACIILSSYSRWNDNENLKFFEA